MNKLNIKKVLGKLFEPIDVAVLVYFRIVFGLIMLWEVYRYFSHDWISSYWIKPTYYLTYYGFSWVKPLPGAWMYVLFGLLGILCLFIILGFKYRISTTLFFIGFSYVFLLDESRYLNHFYLIILISFLMIFIPANRRFSFDSWLNPKIRSETAPAWSLWILMFLIGIVYFYGGIAKLNMDWLMGEPMRAWLSARTEFPLIGHLFTQEWMVYLFVYGGLLIDLLAVPFLLWKPSRIYAFGCITLFHILNAFLFTIGIFPWFMIFATLIFFNPSWPRKLIRGRELKLQENRNSINLTKKQKLIVVFLLLFVMIQLIVPLRHFLYPGSVHWTEEGHKFSWHMKLRDKETTEIVFFAKESGTGISWKIDPLNDMNKRQLRKLSTRPEKILQYAHYLADKLEKVEGHENIEIRATVYTSLNSREPQLLIDPTVDLAAQTQGFKHKKWIMPLKE